MSGRLSIKAPGLEDLAKRLSAVGAKLKDKRGMANAGGLIAKQEVQGNFRAQRNADGSRWPRLRYRVGGTPLNNVAGRMPKGIEFRPTASGFIVAAGDATKDFNAVHNYGSKKWKKGQNWEKGPFKGKPKGVPQRQYMYLNQKSQDKVVRAARAYVKLALARG